MTPTTRKWIRRLKLSKADAAKVGSIEAEQEADTSSVAAMRAGRTRVSGWNLVFVDGWLSDEGRNTAYANDLDELLDLIAAAVRD